MKVKLIIVTGLISLTTMVNNPVFAQTSNSNNKPNNTKSPITTTEDAAKTETVKKLLEITGTKNLYEQMLTQVFQSLQDQYPEVPAKYWSRFASEINTDDILGEIIPLYSKYYTNKELEQLLAFYQTPLGRKTIDVLPELSKDAGEVGIKFGRQAAERALRKLADDGYLRPSKPKK